MNSFDVARAANAATRNHACKSDCPRNSKGFCRTQVKLWDAQNAAAALWNAGPLTEVPPAAPEPAETLSQPSRGYL